MSIGDDIPTTTLDIACGPEGDPAELKIVLGMIAWDVARVAWEKTGDKSKMDALLAAGVPVPESIRDLLLSGLRQERSGRPGKLRHTPEQIVWLIESARLRGHPFSDAEREWSRSPAFLHVARCLGVSVGTVRKMYQAVPEIERNRIKAQVPGMLRAMGYRG